MIAYNGSLIMKLNNPATVIDAIKIAKTTLKGESVYVCRHTWNNVDKLRNLGLDAPTPTLNGWAFQGRFKPMQHQISMFDFMLRYNKCFNLSDMGTGKTAGVLWPCEYLIEQKVIKKILIICPVSVLQVWANELFNIAPSRSNVILYGSRTKRLELLEEDTTYYIINYDGLTTIVNELKQIKFDLIIADEAATYRNSQTKRYKIFKDFVKTIPRLWMLTGTPTPTAPTDAYALIKLVNPSFFKQGFGAFRELTMRRLNQFLWVPKKDANEIVYKLLNPAIRFTKEECVDLPSMTYVNRECVLSSEQIKAYEQMRRYMVMEKSGEAITASNAAVKLIKLEQICCGVVKDNDGNPHYLDDTPRLNLLKEVIEETGHKAIVFIPFKAVMHRVKEFLDSKCVTCNVVNGDTNRNKREEIFNEFQNGPLSVLLAHPKTAAHGLNLTASSYIIWYAPIFSAESYLQGNMRIHRFGQIKPCTIVHLGASLLEWCIYEALNGKIKMQEAILKLYENIIK
ncbi:MAG: DEAD/DEAH box helicase [Candidatus Dormibacteria bacterium]